MHAQHVAMDALYGCTKCRYAKSGCGACRDAPVMERPASVRWRPEAGRYQTEVPSAPTFHPTPEQFADPVAYISSIRPQAEKCAPVLFNHMSGFAGLLCSPTAPLSVGGDVCWTVLTVTCSGVHWHR